MTTSLNKKHRRVWHDNYGDIPLDENGMTYEIHHINGNHNDNRPDNLKCVSIKEHYNIHKNQGDWRACSAILQRIKKQVDHHDVDESFLKGENHPMYGKNHSEETCDKISKNHADVSGENNGMYGKNHSEETRKKISESKKGQLKGIPKSSETKLKMSQSVKYYTCPHCDKSAKGNSMLRWHFNNCKQKQAEPIL
jgi:hypothetical protein